MKKNGSELSFQTVFGHIKAVVYLILILKKTYFLYFLLFILNLRPVHKLGFLWSIIVVKLEVIH